MPARAARSEGSTRRVNAPVDYRIEGSVAVITMNDPDRRNALSQPMRSGLRQAFERFAADGEALVGILTGAGERAFCAGGDLAEMSEHQYRAPGPDHVAIIGRNIETDKVLVAAVNGLALGGGFMMAQMADLVVAAQHAVFGMPEARWGRGAPWSVPLAHMVPQRIWMELAVLGQPISAQRAYEVGLVNRVVTSDQLMDTAMDMARTVAANAPLTVRASRRMIRLAGDLGLSEAWDAADELFVEVYESEDAQEGPRSFVEKRPAHWKGR